MTDPRHDLVDRVDPSLPDAASVPPGRHGALRASPPVPVLPEELVEPLRADLSTADYTVDGIHALLGNVAGAATSRDRMLPMRRILDRAGVTPLSVMLRLFSLGEALDGAAVGAAFPRVGVAGMVRIGLVLETLQGYVAACDLHPYGDETHTWWVASDLGETATGEPLAPDHVLGVGGASMTLASWTPRRGVARVLDLGTGCGVQALHASTHARTLVATDISARALGFAAFNAALAGIDLDLRRGDLFAPVTGAGGTPETFDLVVSNPPFVISPRTGELPLYEYRDGGRAGDALIRAVVQGVGTHLAPGGVACFLANWEVRGDADWREEWRRWSETPGCADLDVWVIGREYQDVAEYAEMWTRDSGQRPGTPEFDAWVSAWLDDFESRDVERVWFGVVVLQRPATDRARWVEFTEATAPVASPMGPVIDAGLRARTWLSGADDQALFDEAWVVAPDVTEERHTRPGDADPQLILVRQGGGFRRAVTADTALAAFVSVCDGELTGAVAASAIGALLDVDPAEVRAGLAPHVRELVAHGMLVPVGEMPAEGGPPAG